VEMSLYLRDELLAYARPAQARPALRSEALLLRNSDGQAPRSRPVPSPDPRSSARARERQPRGGRPGRAAGDHPAFLAPYVGHLRGLDRTRPEMDRCARSATPTRSSRSPSTSRWPPGATSTSRRSGR
jgi:hypothetical protein